MVSTRADRCCSRSRLKNALEKIEAVNPDLVTNGDGGQAAAARPRKHKAKGDGARESPKPKKEKMEDAAAAKTDAPTGDGEVKEEGEA